MNSKAKDKTLKTTGGDKKKIEANIGKALDEIGDYTLKAKIPGSPEEAILLPLLKPVNRKKSLCFNDDEGKSLASWCDMFGKEKYNQPVLDVNVIDENGIKTKANDFQSIIQVMLV